MTITRKELPDDAWADIRDQADVSERLRRPVRALQVRLAKDPAFSGVVDRAKAEGVKGLEDIDQAQAVAMTQSMGPEALGILDDLNDRLIVGRVAGWSFDIPVSLDSLLDLPGGAYDALQKICAEGALQSGPDFSPSPDENSFTDPSLASA